MATLAELCKQFDVDLDGIEKQAEDSSAHEEAESPALEKAEEKAEKKVEDQFKKKGVKELEQSVKKEVPTDEKSDEIKKEGGQMNSLRDLFEALCDEDQQVKTASSHEEYEEQYDLSDLSEDDIEKIAEYEAEELIKVAEEHKAAGRFMAQGFYDELTKIAAAVEEAPVGQEIPQQLPVEEAATQSDPVARMTGAEVQTQNDVKDVLVEKAVQDLLGKKKGLNPQGQTGQDNKVAPDANQA